MNPGKLKINTPNGGSLNVSPFKTLYFGIYVKFHGGKQKQPFQKKTIF